MSAGSPRILVLGATSAIAAEVAVLYAARGARLHLVGRNGDKLAEVAARCGAAHVTTQQADFADLDRCAAVGETLFAALRTGGFISDPMP